MKSFALQASFVALAASSAYALSLYEFPDCKNGPLNNITICDPTADYWERAQSLVKMFTLDELIANTVNNATGVERLGIAPRNWWSEALHGVSTSPGVTFASNSSQPFSSATDFPNGISLGASFDDEMVYNVGNIIKKEVRAFNNAGRSGINLYSPANINAFRDPRWGRGQETPGEDLLHISNFARAIVKGVQGEDPTKIDALLCAKHFVAYDIDSNPDRYGYDAQVNMQDFAEFYTPQFKAAVRDAKAGSLMSSYNSINGVPPSASKYLLQTLARDTWKLDDKHNYVTSDCDALENVYYPHHYAKTPAEAVGISFEAGLDLNCGKYSQLYLKDAIDQNFTSRATVERSVTRMYASLVRLGVFDSAESQPLRQLGWNDVNSKEAQDLAYEAAVAGTVLLKNDGLLPASPDKYKTVAVIGPYTDATTQLSGNYAGPGPYMISVHEGVKTTYSNVLNVTGTSNGDPLTDGFPDALEAAKKADLVIFAGGIDNSIESESLDRYSLELNANQPDLIQLVAALGKPMVMIQYGGGQIDQTPYISNPNVSAYIWGGYPGQAGGWAITDIISGKRSPSGRLTVTSYPADYINQVNKTDMTVRPSSTSPGRTYAWYNGQPVFPFGFGLHYTNFSGSLTGDAGKSFDIQQLLSGTGNTTADYKDLIVIANVTAPIKNDGQTKSDYAALLYANSTNGPEPYPLRKLVSYTKLHDISGGAEKTASLPITVGALARYETNGDMALYPGTYNLMLDSFTSPLATATITLTGDREVVEAFPQSENGFQ